MTKRVGSILIGLMILCFVFAFLDQAIASEWPQDLGGRDIRINTRWTNVTPLGPRGEFDWYDPDPRLEAHIEQIEEMFNVSIHFMEPIIHGLQAPGQIAERFIAGDVDFDYVNLAGYDVPSIIAQDFLYPLTHVLDDAYYNSLPSNFRLGPETTDFMGETYRFSSMCFSNEAKGIWWNKTMFEAEGLPSLYEVYEAGDWTWDRLTEFAVALTRDTTGDGETDQRGIYSRITNPWDVMYWLPNNNANIAKYRDGRWEVTIDEEEAIALYEWLVRLTHELEVVGGSWGAGTAGMEAHSGHAVAGSAFQDLDDEIGFVPFPQGPNADELIVVSGNLWLGSLAATVEEPREVIEVVHALYQNKEPYVDIEQWEEEYWQEWALLVDDRETLEHWQWMQPRVVETMFKGEAIDAGFFDHVHPAIFEEGRSVSSTMAEFKPVLQAVIDELFDQ